MKLHLFALVAGFLVVSAFAAGLDDVEQGELDDETQKLIQNEAAPASDQQEVRKAEESEGDDDDDEGFDKELCLEKESRPAEPLPDTNTVKELYAKASVSVVGLKMPALDYNSRFTYWNPYSWHPVWKCCPRIFNYGCRSSSKRLGIFRHWNHYRTEWCYPLWPVYIRRCLCNECLVRDWWCPRRGRCNRRYSRRSFWAVCNRRFGWTYVRYITNKWLPTSCYCRAHKYTYSAVTEKTCSN